MFQYIYMLRQLVSQVLGRIYILILNDEVCFDFDLRATARTAIARGRWMLSQMRYEFGYFHASMRYCKHVMLHFMHALL